MKCRFCEDDSLDKSLVAGKIVFCDAFSKGGAALAARAAGEIIPQGDFQGSTIPFPVPTSCLDGTNTTKIQQYMKSARYF